MNNKKVRLICLILFVAVVVQSFGLDIGGFLDASSSFSSSQSYSLYQKDKLSLWLDSGQGRTMSFYLRGSYTYAIDQPYLFDLERLDLRGRFPGVFGPSSLFDFSLGRSNFSDFSGNVLNHSVDGLWVELSFPRLVVATSMGYTGLLFRESASIVISKADLSESNRTDIVLAPHRLLEAVEFVFPELLGRQDLFVSFLAQQDLRPEEDLVAEGEENEVLGNGGRVSTQYYGLGLSGPLSAGLYLNSFFYLGSGKTLSYLEDTSSGTGFSYQYASMLNYLAGLGLRYYFEQALYSRIEVEFLFSSGDEDYDSFTEGNRADRAGIFVPISQSDTGLVFSPQLGNLFYVAASYSLKPLSGTGYRRLEEFQTVLKATAFFRSGTGPISVEGIDPASDSLYLGTEIDGIVNFRPFSDLGLSFTAGIFVPNLAAEREAEVLMAIDFSFSF